MAGEKLEFVDRLGELKEVGDSIKVFDEDYETPVEKMQMARALAYHGCRQWKKFSYVRIDGGYVIVYKEKRGVIKKKPQK